MSSMLAPLRRQTLAITSVTQRIAQVRAPRSVRLASTAADAKGRPLPLAGLKVLELGQLIAGPYCGQILAHFGADVIKVEPPKGGDPLRYWRELDPEDGQSPWWRSLNRNKRSIGIDLRSAEGQKIAKQLALQADVVIENFTPGTIEKWGLIPDELYKTKPDLVFTRISGWGQTGPRKRDGGFAAVCEGYAGFRYVNGFPDANGDLDGPPVRPNLSLGDSLAGVSAALGTVLALIARGKANNGAFARTGQTVDVAIYESVMNMMEGCIPNYDRTGSIRKCSGAGVSGIVPTRAFACKEPSSYAIIGGNGDTMYQRLMERIGRTDLTGDAYKGNKERVAKQQEIEDAIEAWTRQHTVDEVLTAMTEVRVPCGPINSTEDIVNDPHVQARGMIEEVEVHSQQGKAADGTNTEEKSWTVKMPGMSPILEFGPTKTRWAGPDLGAHTDEILAEVGIQGDEARSLRQAGAVS